ncbi:hypothetical protein [Azohydromonas australica]|nr:hypothetical protein [Azohydromonas australica]
MNATTARAKATGNPAGQEGLAARAAGCNDAAQEPSAAAVKQRVQPGS